MGFLLFIRKGACVLHRDGTDRTKPIFFLEEYGLCLGGQGSVFRAWSLGFQRSRIKGSRFVYVLISKLKKSVYRALGSGLLRVRVLLAQLCKKSCPSLAVIFQMLLRR